MENQRPLPSTRVLSALGYLPFFCFLPLYLCRDDEFAQQHAKQSLVLLIIYIILWIGIWLINVIFRGILGHILIIGFLFNAIGWLVYHIIGTILSFAYLILIIVGIIAAGLGNQWEIPVISTYAKHLKI
ncbi:MAG: hypothetical protein N2201_06280 [candidate division WOR-3 bacterium]|nr:hypothetical protein [candidate division WOR-3 bacterium]